MNEVREKLLSHVRKGVCWEWFAGKSSSGYGYMIVSGKSKSVHRISWEVHRGPIPSGMWLDHLCHNRACVNPDHLRLVTPRQNALENNNGLSAQNILKTHCDNGHEFTPENTHIRRRSAKSINLRRVCRICGMMGTRKYRAKINGGLTEFLKEVEE